MQQHKIVEDYLDGAIPQNISAKTKEEIRVEMESHIYDRAEFYIEIGFDEETAIGKAVEEMGDTDSVRENFNALYNDSILKAVLLFFGICTWNLISIVAEWGYMNFVDPTIYVLPSVAMLGVFLAVFVFLTVYTIKCIRQNLHKQIMSVVAAFVLVTLGSFVTSGIFFPIINAGKLIFRYITNGAESDGDADIIIINIVLLTIYTVVSFVYSEKNLGFRKKPYRLSLKQITAVLSVSCLLFLAIYGFAFAKYEWLYTNGWAVEDSEDSYISNITAEQREIYNNIELGENISDAEKELAEKGFVKQTGTYKDFLENHDCSLRITEFVERGLENSDENEHLIFSYTHTIEEEYCSYDITCCIFVSYNDQNKIDYKLFLPETAGTLYASYLNYNHGEETKKWFDNLQKGGNCESSLEFIRNTGAFILEDQKCVGQDILSTYKIYFDCYYPITPKFIDFLLDSCVTVVNMYEFEILAQNGVVSDYKLLSEIYEQY